MIAIELSDDEALVLSDIIHRISENDELFPDIAERQALWAVEKYLDKMPQLINEDYEKLLNESKNRIRYVD